MSRSKKYQSIPTFLKENEFNEFVLPYLTRGRRGPKPKLSFFKLFNYILKLMHTGCQWEEIPIALDEDGKPEIHYSNIFRRFKLWAEAGCFDKIFISTVARLFKNNLLDTSVIHGDGTSTTAKKGEII